MAFSLSPAVQVQESDLTTTIPSVASSVGALVGEFAWGPVEEIRTLYSEDVLRKYFGNPNNRNFADWFTAANFLYYSNNLKLVRQIVEPELSSGSWVDPSGAAASYNAADAKAGSPAEFTGSFVKNSAHFENNISIYEDNGQSFIAKYPGSKGNKIDVSARDGATWNDSPEWKYANKFDKTPDSDEIAIIVRFDNQVVESFLVSTDPDAKDYSGVSMYVETKINRQSDYIWAVANNIVVSGQDINFEDRALGGGADGDSIGTTERQYGWDLFSSPNEIDINLAMVGGADQTSAQYVLENIAESRKDVVAFISPQQKSVVNSSDPVSDIIDDRNSYPSSSYGFFDGNFKYQYDRYNDVFRWIPLNGDMAGLAARTDYETETWFSPAGYSRGLVKNTVKLAFNPKKAQRDDLYKNEVNPVLTEAGEGTVLLGDKTMQAEPSSFDKINIRRLFIVLEKAIATAAKYQLFELNDEQTRRQFRNMVVPFLRNIEGRRGIENFHVVADSTNNTSEVIQNNQFVADIYVKPVYSINFISLNFTAVSPNVEFEEVVYSSF